MSSKPKNLFFSLLIGLLFFYSAKVNLFGLIWANYSSLGFCRDCDTQLGMNNYVTEGAGYFLNAYSDVLLFLNKIEISERQGTNYEELQKILDRSIFNMKKTRNIYYSLVKLSDNTPYEKETLTKLSSFDFLAFREKNGLNKPIFNELTAYLEKGDIRGFYYKLSKDIEIALNILYKIKSCIDAMIFPNIKDLWNLNNKFINMFLFGQYAAQIFHGLQ